MLANSIMAPDQVRRLESRRLVAMGVEICRAASQADRVARYAQPIPTGMRLGWTCDVSYCGNPQHFSLEQNKNSSRRDYSELRKRLWKLGEDEWFDLPTEPSSEQHRNKFQAALRYDTPHFIVRSLPRGGVRVIRTGTFLGDNMAVIRKFPNLVNVAKFKNSIGSVWLGMMWGTWDDLPKERVSRCCIKGCAFPQRKDGLCPQHLNDLGCVSSEPGELGKWDIASRATEDNPSPNPLLTTGWVGEERTMFLNTFREAGITPDKLTGKTGIRRSRIESTNDKWWKENVIDKGIVVDGVITKRSRYKDVEEEKLANYDRLIEDYSAVQSADAIRKFWHFDGEEIYAEED